MTYKGTYEPANPEKYKGDPSRIVYRSSWERRFMYWCDTNPDVLSWASEEVIIPYRCATDNRMHRYFVDFWVEKVVNRETGEKERWIVEVKPSSQTKVPKKTGRKTEKTYLKECQTYAKNISKWDAAKAWAEKHGHRFLLVTENTKGLLPRKPAYKPYRKRKRKK